MTPRLTPLSWRKLVCVFEQIGYRQAGQRGSHLKLEKPGVARPLIVPKYDQIGLDIITNLIRTAGITREAFLAALRSLLTPQLVDPPVCAPHP